MQPSGFLSDGATLSRITGTTDLEADIEYEAELFAQLFATEDKDEGITAFFEDRDPEWRVR